MPKRRTVHSDGAVRASSGLEKILDHPLLSPEQERMYAKVYRETRDEESRRKLIESNYRLVAKIAESYKGSIGPSIEFDDLIIWGTYGLIRAVEKFDYKKGFKLSTYATFWIRQAIGRAIIDRGRTIRLPAHVSQKLHRLNRDTDFLRQVLKREPTVADLEERFGYTGEQVAIFAAANDAIESLDVAYGEDGTMNRQEILSDGVDAFAELITKESRRELANELLSKLPDRERVVIELRYGLQSAEGYPMPLEEVSWHLGISKARVGQVERQALRRLRNLFRNFRNDL